MTNNLKASLRKILFKDYTSFIFFMFCIVGIVTGPFVLLVWLICLPFLARRVGLLKGTFKNGQVVKGAIVDRRFWRGRWTVYYAYKVNEKLYRARNYIIAFKLPFKKGDAVDVVVNDKKPNVAFLQEIYKA